MQKSESHKNPQRWGAGRGFLGERGQQASQHPGNHYASNEWRKIGQFPCTSLSDNLTIRYYAQVSAFHP